MSKKKWTYLLLVLFFLICSGSLFQWVIEEEYWPKETKEIRIKSSFDGELQKAYVYYSSKKKRPIVVSLHTWDGDYEQFDSISILSIEKDINYIHPNFRGANKNPKTCCSPEVISDIDDAIEHLILNNDASKTDIYIIGVSGGGYATLCSYIKSRYSAKIYSAWASISSLEDWYYQSKERDTGFDLDILNCINNADFKSKSPLNWIIPHKKLSASKLLLYAGINDGHSGSVPITHSINFYNKLNNALNISPNNMNYVTEFEQNQLLMRDTEQGDFEKINGRQVLFRKSNGSGELIIFEGGHEMLLPYAFEELLGNNYNF